MSTSITIPNYLDEESSPLQIGEYWYDETTGEVFTFRTMLHPTLSASNYKIIYPEVSKFHVDDPTVRRLYPRNDSLFQTLSGYSFIGPQQQINIVSVEKPLVSYNKQTKTFVFTFLGIDISGYKYLFTYYLKRKDEELLSDNIDCIKPDLDISNVTFANWPLLSGEFIPTTVLQPFLSGDLINFENALTAHYGIPFPADNKTFNVIVSGSTYYLDNTTVPTSAYTQQPTLTLYRGRDYRFHQYDTSNDTHGFRLSLSADGTHSGGVEYTSDVSHYGYPGNPGGFSVFSPISSTPSTLYYYCSAHSGYGGVINVVDAGVTMTSCQSGALSNPNDTSSTGQLRVLFVGDRNDGMHTLWLGCSSAEYTPGLFYPFPAMYNTTYALPTGIFNIDSDIEVTFNGALWHSTHGDSNKAIYTMPFSGYWTGADGLTRATGTYTSFLTTFSGSTINDLDPNYQPGNGFSIFFYDNDIPVGPIFTPYNDGFNNLINYPVTGFNPGGVGESLGYKPYTGPIQLTDVLSSPSATECMTLTANGLANGYIGVGFDVAGGFSSTVTGASANNRIVVVGGAWNNYDDLYVTPQLNALSSSTLPDITLHQSFSGLREANLKYATYKVALEECGTRIRVNIKPQGMDKFYEYVDYRLSEQDKVNMPPTSALKVGFAFSTSDKVMTCEMKSINTYGRYITNPIFKTSCYTNCQPNFPSLPYTEFCPVSTDIEVLRTEEGRVPIVTEGQPLCAFGMNYIVESYDDTTYYNIDLGELPKPGLLTPDDSPNNNNSSGGY